MSWARRLRPEYVPGPGPWDTRISGTSNVVGGCVLDALAAVGGPSVHRRVDNSKGHVNYEIRSRTRLQDEGSRLGTKRAKCREGEPPRPSRREEGLFCRKYGRYTRKHGKEAEPPLMAKKGKPVFPPRWHPGPVQEQIHYHAGGRRDLVREGE